MDGSVGRLTFTGRLLGRYFLESDYSNGLIKILESVWAKEEGVLARTNDEGLEGFELQWCEGGEFNCT